MIRCRFDVFKNGVFAVDLLSERTLILRRLSTRTRHELLYALLVSEETVLDKYAR